MKERHQNFLTPVEHGCLHFLNMQTKTFHSMLNLRLTVEGLLGELDQNFPYSNPHPDDQTNHIMYRAGQRSIIDWIRQRIEEES